MITRKKTMLLALSMTMGLCACKAIHDKAFRIYVINSTKKWNSNGYDESESLCLDKENNQFVWTFKTDVSQQLQKTNYFTFELTCSKNDCEYDCSYFKFSSDGTPIILSNINGQDYKEYKFKGPKTINIYYGDSDEELKEEINSDNYNVYCRNETWLAK